MDFTDRLKFDITTSSGIAFGDIDMSSSEENDGFRSLNFTIHYDLLLSVIIRVYCRGVDKITKLKRRKTQKAETLS